ncbi:nucleotidyltransferase domain-containing protein [Aeromonas salmonicida]|uniref:nucleotidyltransferase domain-containing protein n=1 Tax=Aeromonas salmonicida TaxID=645 RepID=UPI00125F9543|nr:nucleotidyltransferase domain-containing protein [Aeromonas salmonicida]
MLEERKKFTSSKLLVIRESIERLISEKFSDYKDQIAVVTTGSFGRDEASDESDLDWYVIAAKDCPLLRDESQENLSIVQSIVSELKALISKLVVKETGSTGTFSTLVDETSLYQNYGGDKDTNQAFTRRMLYLLESRYLFNESLYNIIKGNIVQLYIKEDIPDTNINRFMLNDIIRYYRTICTDYEYKVNEEEKEWGLRKIKLRFSRKLIYFSGLITVAQTCNMTRAKKVEETLRLLSLTPIERIIAITNNTAPSDTLISTYCYFLEKISQKEIRQELDDVTRETRSSSDTYRDLKNKSNIFSQEMELILKKLYPDSHPIYISLVF